MKAKATVIGKDQLSNLGSVAFLFLGLWFVYRRWTQFLMQNDRWAGAICCDVIGDLQDHSRQPNMYRIIVELLSAHGQNGPVPNQFLFLIISALLCWAYFSLKCQPWIGSVSALCLISVPVIWFTHLRLDVYFLIPMLLLLFFVIAEITNGYRKLWSAAPLSVALIFAALYSPRETDNLLLLMVFAASIWGTLFQYGFRTVRAVNIVVAIVISIYVVAPLFEFTSPEGASYYLSEGALFTGSFEGLSSYWSHFFWKGSGPILGTLLFCALFYSVRFWREVASVLFAFLIPLCLISIIAKKNIYYSYVIWPVLPILAGHCLARLNKTFAVAFGGLWLTISLVGLANEVKPNAQDIKMIARLSTPSTFGGNFQTSDYGPDLTPHSYPWLPEALQVVRIALQDVDCDQHRVEFYSTSAIISELFVRHWSAYPCVYWRHFPNYDADAKGFLFLTDSLDPQDPGYSNVGQFLVGSQLHSLWIFSDDQR